MEIQPHDRILVSDVATRIYVRKKILAPLMLQPGAATMLNGRIGGGVTEWHSYQSMVWAHSRRALLFSINAWAHSQRALLFSINAWAHSPRAANHPKIVTIRALYRDPMSLKVLSNSPCSTVGTTSLHTNTVLYHGTSTVQVHCW